MSDYISREAVMELRPKNIEIINSSAYIELDELLDFVGEISAADVEPVRRGRWERCFEDWRQQIEGDKCSLCGFEYYGTGISRFLYCPNCGAKMDLEEDAYEM